MIYFLLSSFSFSPYFDSCDGIFLNYNWTESGLSLSRKLAKERKGEVYVGIDVFGRGCPGGGGYNSCEARACKYYTPYHARAYKYHVKHVLS